MSGARSGQLISAASTRDMISQQAADIIRERGTCNRSWVTQGGSRRRHRCFLKLEHSLEYCVCRCGAWGMTRYTRPDDTEARLREDAAYLSR